MSSADALILHDVTKRFGDFVAVDSLSLHIPRGALVGVLGPNGAGKTTTLRMVMSIIYPDAGALRVLDHDRASDVKDRIGYLPEERGLYRKMTVEQTLRYFGQLKGLSGARLAQRIDEELAQVGLGAWRSQRVEALSKGMQQKLQFVCTILHEPDLVILDEPFSGLDPLNAEVLRQMMLRLHARGVTVLFSTHEMESAERMCDRIVLINRGRKLLDGRLAEVRQAFARQQVLLEGHGDFSGAAGLPGVLQVQRTAGGVRLTLAEGADTNALLREALVGVELQRFEVLRPSLREIFVELVGGDHDARSGQSLPTAVVGGAD